MGATLQKQQTQSAEPSNGNGSRDANWMPRGVHPRWLDVIRTLITRNRNGNNDGIAIISINIIVDGNGTPILWAEPRIRRLSPMASASDNLAEIINGLMVDS